MNTLNYLKTCTRVLAYQSSKLFAFVEQVMLLSTTFVKLASHIVGNKAKGRISKRVSQENKARQIFTKRTCFIPYVCVSRGKKCWFFGKSDVLSFALLPYYR